MYGVFVYEVLIISRQLISFTTPSDLSEPYNESKSVDIALFMISLLMHTDAMV